MGKNSKSKNKRVNDTPSSSSSVNGSNNTYNQAYNNNTTTSSHEDNNIHPTNSSSKSATQPSNVNLVNIFNKIVQFQSEKSEWDYFETHKIVTLTDPVKSNIIEKCHSDFQELQHKYDHNMIAFNMENDNKATTQVVTTTDSTDNMNTSTTKNNFKNDVISLIEFKYKNLKMLYKTLHEATLHLKSIIDKENQGNLKKAKLIQQNEISSQLSMKLQESCRQQQKRNKQANENFQKLCSEETTKNDLLRNSCDTNIEDVLKSVNTEEEILIRKETDNNELAIKIIEFQKSVQLRKQQADAYAKAIELQSQIKQAQSIQIQKNNQHNIILLNNYNNRILQQQNKLTFLNEQLQAYATKFGEFEKMLST